MPERNNRGGWKLWEIATGGDYLWELLIHAAFSSAPAGSEVLLLARNAAGSPHLSSPSRTLSAQRSASIVSYKMIVLGQFGELFKHMALLF